MGVAISLLHRRVNKRGRAEVKRLQAKISNQNDVLEGIVVVSTISLNTWGHENDYFQKMMFEMHISLRVKSPLLGFLLNESHGQ